MRINKRPTSRASRLRGLARMALGGMTFFLALSAVGPPLGIDVFWPGMAFTYAPRIILALMAFLLGGVLLFQGSRGLGAVNCIAGLALLLTSGLASWLQPAAAAPEGRAFRLLAFNTEDAHGEAQELARRVRALDVDFVCLQEVSSQHREEFTLALPEYFFFWTRDEEPVSPYENPRRKLPTCVTGVRASIVASHEPVELAAAITGYRTNGVRVRLGDRWVWIVNVHTTKPAWVDGDWLDPILKAREKAIWHRQEHDLLQSWLGQRGGDPVILAGDFNAPEITYNTRFTGFRNAHFSAGSGLHATFPRRFPVLGIDNVLGSADVRFHEYRTLDAGFSDHRAQICAFTIVSGR